MTNITILGDVMIWEDEDVTQFQKVLQMSTEEVVNRAGLLKRQTDLMKGEIIELNCKLKTLQDEIKRNAKIIIENVRLPYLVSTVSEIFENELEGQEEYDADVHENDERGIRYVVIKTTKRETILLPILGYVNEMKLKIGDLVGVKDNTHSIIKKLPIEYDNRLKDIEVDEKPIEIYSDIGGLNEQIQEVIEAIVLPLTHETMFDKIGIHPPKGVLIYGAPGTGKTLLARACAAETKSTFFKISGTQLVQNQISDGPKLVRDVFALARKKAPAIIFIDDIDAIGSKRFNSNKAGDREVQRTMLELLNQMDGFSPSTCIKVIAATNRVDLLDPALLRSGRLDRKIEFPEPDEVARCHILQIHSRKMKVSTDVNYQELARDTDTFNGAQCQAVCYEAGMIALRRNANCIAHQDFLDAIREIRGKKKENCYYYV